MMYRVYFVRLFVPFLLGGGLIFSVCGNKLIELSLELYWVTLAKDQVTTNLGVLVFSIF